MAVDKRNKWIYSRETLEDSPSRKAGVDNDKELSYRQQAANLIQDMGQRLSVNQLTINTAIVYMHRFYVYHSFTVFSRYAIAPTALFLAAKVEEQPKKLQHVLQICHACLHPDKPTLDAHSDAYMKQAQELVQNEIVLLQSLGFEISVDHPHTHVVKCTQLVKASRDLSQMAYFMATNSLHLTTFCLLYKPTVVAAMCIHLSCKWSNYEIPLSSDGKPYWSYMDPTVTESLLDKIITEFLKILNRCPTRLRKLKNYRPSQNKEEQETRQDDSKPSASNQSRPAISQGPVQRSQAPLPPPQTPQPSAKEKKQTLSIEEYKKAQAAKSMSKPNIPGPSSHRPSQHHPNPGSQARKTEAHGSGSHSGSSSNAHRPPQPHHPKHASGAQPLKTAGDSRAPENYKNMMRPPQQVKVVEHGRGAARPHDVHHKNHGMAPQPKTDGSSRPVEELVVPKELEGRMQNEILQQQTSSSRNHHQSQRPSTSRSSDHRAGVKEQVKRQSSNDKSRPHETDARKAQKLDYKQMVEMYHKNPDKLRHYLKHKAQSVRLSNEEKNLLLKLQAKEDERRKRKAEAEAAAVKAKPSRPAPDAMTVESPNGPLTLRIKLGAKPSHLKNKTSSKGPVSDQATRASPSRKRIHDDTGGHPSSSKHARRSEKHKHHHHRSSGSATSGDGKHRNSHHRHSGSAKPSGIDDTIFQKSLSDAMSKVQQAGIPTVTLKRANNNGKEANYFMTIPVEKRHGFDPTDPVSAEVPDDIFEEDQAAPAEPQVSGGESSAYTSTPESGEIKESPAHSKVTMQHGNKVSSLFSPDAVNADSQLMRSSSGYHSSQDNDYNSGFLPQNHYVQ